MDFTKADNKHGVYNNQAFFFTDSLECRDKPVFRVIIIAIKKTQIITPGYLNATIARCPLISIGHLQDLIDFTQDRAGANDARGFGIRRIKKQNKFDNDIVLVRISSNTL